MPDVMTGAIDITAFATASGNVKLLYPQKL